ncbi:hypothetical protein GN244_ATG05907 [Phytophthora infestans]|uniref:Transmembrane protein n=1 Tax=Phytophthora infestans TaxID=4787 RepID=A0A833WXZ9_PHYIN|nr:hypothetical protein GN244_ATG05907 [Phytophthora infestans]KAF4142186.1 hypothetical protein GN958_ATG08625 [Phytophthora infestans]KAF4144254.1 hypothetical protein GN958_ATG06575 [Phytophthora infestans]
MAAIVLAWLVVLSATVLTLEIQRRLLLARMLGALVMLLGWSFLLTSELQLKAVCCSVVYHGLAEGLRQWQRNFPCVFERRKDRKVVLWLLFWARVFIWGATLGGIAVFTLLTRSHESTTTSTSYWREAGALAFYYEVVEVLAMLYFADEELPYLWHKRVGHWLGASLVGFLESSGRLDAMLRGPLLAGMSPLALVGVLFMVMWLSIEIPWDRIAEASGPSLADEDPFDKVEHPGQNDVDERFESSRTSRRRELFVETNRDNGFYFRP